MCVESEKQQVPRLQVIVRVANNYFPLGMTGFGTGWTEFATGRKGK